MGARLTQAEMARALGRELARRIPESSVARWESGVKLPGADVYRAYVNLSGSARPTDLGGIDERAMPGQRLQALEARLRLLERDAGRPVPNQPIAPEDLASTTEAAQLAGVTRQTVHDWVRARRVRSERMGRRVLVSRSDIIAVRDSPPGD
jgi:excisionase family DNA binding protein